MDDLEAIRALRPVVKAHLRALIDRPGIFRPEIEGIVKITAQSVKDILGHNTPKEYERLSACLALYEGIKVATFLKVEPDYKGRHNIEMAFFIWMPPEHLAYPYTIIVQKEKAPTNDGRIYTLRGSYASEILSHIKSEQPPG